MTTLTVQEVITAVPATLKASVNQGLVDTLNQLQHDPDVAQAIREGFISYASVVRDGKYKMEDYLNAVTYCTFKQMEYSNHDAWCATFPARHAALVQRGVTKSGMSSHVSMYAKGKLVNQIMEQSMVEDWLLYRDLRHKSLMKLANLMETAQSEKVQMEAANALANHTAKPNNTGTSINIELNENSGMNEMTQLLEKLALQQIDNLKSGAATIKEVNAQRIYENQP